ncbi:hypothetical protein ACFL2Q_10695 [Thermodesulfobacteriota bacterium]
MRGLCSPVRFLLVLPLLLLFACALFTVADAQGLPQLHDQIKQSNDGSLLHGNDAIPVSSGMFAPLLPKIPNLEFGFMYSFGRNVRTGRFTADYILPFELGRNSVLFGEVHAERLDFWSKASVSPSEGPVFTAIKSSTSNRTSLSLGAGYRTMVGENTLIGVNGFYDASRFGGDSPYDTSTFFSRWDSSGGVGLEFAANVAGDDAFDVNFNWYGNLFNKDVLLNAFRNRGGSFDIECGYSHALFNQALDLRLKLVGYQFDAGTPTRGWRGGADLTSRDGMFSLRYEHGSDTISGQYNTVGGFVNVGLQLENLLNGESPFTMPEPVFRSPRNLRRLLGQKVKRNWQQPSDIRSSFKTIFTASTYYGSSLAPKRGEISGFNVWVPFSAVATATRVIVTVQNPPPGPFGGKAAPSGGYIEKNIAFPPNVRNGIFIPAGTHQVVSTNPAWTRGQGFPDCPGCDAFFSFAALNLAGNTENWIPGLLTVEWQE